MFRRHAGSVILLGGWLLMLPPVEKGAAGPGGIEDSRGNVYRVLTEAPLTRWVQEAAYDTAREFERAKEASTLFVDLRPRGDRVAGGRLQGARGAYAPARGRGACHRQ